MLVLAACASAPPKEAPPAAPPPEIQKAPPPPRPKPVVKPPTAPQAQPAPTILGPDQVASLLPPALKDKNGWAADIVAAFGALKIPPSKENVCAVLAEIAQESSFQADPPVPGLSSIVRKELEARREKYGIPQWALDKGLAMQSADGKTYNERIDALKTEKEVSDLYQDMVSEIPMGGKFLADYNPVRTAGPMQVSMEFASSYAASRAYPFPYQGSLRNALFTRKGGLYFGIAYLLDYPARYDSIIYRFADYNAGRYSSRNAAFQRAVSMASKVPLSLDGDLLRFNKDGTPQQEPSQTMRALLTLSPRLNMDRDIIFRSLQYEKTPAFEQTRLYIRVFGLAPGTPRASIPEITLQSPKFARKLTTVMYTQQVGNRYQRCMQK